MDRNVKEEGDEEIIPLAAFNQFLYCPRRCYFIYAEAEFVDNVHTILGTFEHEQVDETTHQIKKGVRVEFGLPVWSKKLKLTGRCDAVEFYPDGTVYPVEYKHGKRQRWINDDIQLAAQALCLEEMLNIHIGKGSIFHKQSQKRREVIFDDTLRQTVQNTAAQIRQLLKQDRRPDPILEQQRCAECSLNEICRPVERRNDKVLLQLHRGLFNPRINDL